jgi:hypothetical protein
MILPMTRSWPYLMLGLDLLELVLIVLEALDRLLLRLPLLRHL